MTGSSSDETLGSTSQSFDSAVMLASSQFVQGFIVGQVALCALLFALIRVFLFRNGHETRILLSQPFPPLKGFLHSMYSSLPNLFKQGGEGGVDRRRRRRRGPSLSTSSPYHPNESQILNSTSYDMKSHSSESCDWLNVLLAQLIAKYRHDPGLHYRLLSSLHKAMNDPMNRPSLLVKKKKRKKKSLSFPFHEFGFGTRVD